MLEYDASGPGGYPDGRRLTDDIADPRIAMVTKGRVTTDGVGPHTDLLELRYLGAPHAARHVALSAVVDSAAAVASMRRSPV